MKKVKGDSLQCGTCMATSGDSSQRAEHTDRCANAESLYCTPGTDVILYTNYT